MKRFLLASIISVFSLYANADVLSGDFRTEADLPYCCNAFGPVSGAAVNQTVGAGVELNETASFSNPSWWTGGVVFMDYDPTKNILTLISQDTSDFQLFTASIKNMVFSAGELITGIQLISNDLTDVGLIPTLSFTGDSISIRYDAFDANNDSAAFNFTGGTASFQILTGSSTVPEPSSLLLFAVAFLGLITLRRRSN